MHGSTALSQPKGEVWAGLGRLRWLRSASRRRRLRHIMCGPRRTLNRTRAMHVWVCADMPAGLAMLAHAQGPAAHREGVAWRKETQSERAAWAECRLLLDAPPGDNGARPCGPALFPSHSRVLSLYLCPSVISSPFAGISVVAVSRGPYTGSACCRLLVESILRGSQKNLRQNLPHIPGSNF